MKKTWPFALAVLTLGACVEQPIVPEADAPLAAVTTSLDAVALAGGDCIVENFSGRPSWKSWTSRGYRYTGLMWHNFGGIYTWNYYTIEVRRLDGQPFTVRGFRYLIPYRQGPTDYFSSKGGAVRVQPTNQKYHTLSLAGNPDFEQIDWFRIDPTGRSKTALDDLILCTGDVSNQPPVADAGPDQTIEATGPTTTVSLDGSGSSDPDGDAITYSWSGAGAATGPTPSFDLGLGAHTFVLTVTDANGASSTDEVVVRVVDTTPPDISVDQQLSELWPVNGRMLRVATFSASDLVDPSPDLGVQVSSDEDADARGSGNTGEDWQVVENADGTIDVYLRAERSGTGDGREYVVTATASDASDNHATKTIVVRVPKSRGVGNGVG